ncbi:MAG: type II secretion system F family protein [Bdellovibrionaceae bacterium]|nr:type II secretion system F family protein [Pseudobdellovibrionaceae bacterium]
MLNHYFILISGLILFAFSVYLFVYTLLHTDQDMQALSFALGDERQSSASPIINFSRPLVKNFTLKYAIQIKAKKYREKIEKQIITAGLENELTVDEFIGLQFLWGVGFPLFLLVLNFALQMGIPTPLVIGIGFLGTLFPNFHCQNSKKKRHLSIIEDLPFFIDLLSLSIEAGLDFIGAIQRISEKLGDDRILCKELKIVLKDIKLGSSREKALKSLMHRLDIPEVTSFCSMIIDADKTGASISKVLNEQSKQMRGNRLSRAEKAGATASQAILLPMVLFIVPAIFLVVFAPVILQFMYGK